MLFVSNILSNALVTPTQTSKPRKANRGTLPKHLPRIEEGIGPESTLCDCGHERHVIGEDVSERLDIVPARFRVIVTRRPKYACRSCEGGIVQSPAPAHLIPGGMPTETTVAHVIVSKYADHVPLYRQARICSRQGIDLDRSTLAGRVGRAAFELKPVHDALLASLKQSGKLFMDETIAPVLDPGRRKTRTGSFWALARDDRPWGGGDPPGVAFTYAPGRSGQYAEDIPDGFSGTLQVDGYAGYNRLLKRPARHVRLACCRAHARRRLHEVAQTGTTPIADEGLKQIATLYRIEKDIRGQCPEARQAARLARSKPVVDGVEAWLTAQRAERTIRPIALNRKNALFAGHDVGARNWAMLASLIETCKLNAVDPHAWLSGTLIAIGNGHKQSRIDNLMPWNYA